MGSTTSRSVLLWYIRSSGMEGWEDGGESVMGCYGPGQVDLQEATYFAGVYRCTMYIAG